MQLLTIFAGGPLCTPADETQKTVVKIVSIAMFFLLCVGILFLSRAITKSSLGKGAKTALGILLVLLAAPVCFGIPFLFAFVMTPWCH